MADLPRHTHGAPVIGPTLGFVRNPLTFHLEPYRRLGPMYRMHFMGHDQVVMAGIEANEFVWSPDAPWHHAATMQPLIENYGDTALVALEGEEHLAKRRRLGAGMRPRVLADLTPAIHGLTVERVTEVLDRDVDLLDFCRQLVVHMQSRSLFNLRFDAESETNIHRLEQMSLMAFLLGPARHAMYRLPRNVRARRQVEALLEQAVRGRLAEPSDEPDLLSVVVQQLDLDGEEVATDELVMELKELLFAGTSGGGILLAWSLLFLASRPDWLAELCEELDAFDPAAFNKLHDHPRLLATVLEVERLRPNGAFFPRLAGRDFTFMGVDVPAGTHVHHAVLVPHFDPEVFDEPESFRPERFLVGRDYPSKWASIFGGGPHRCLGAPLARHEVAVGLAGILGAADLDVEAVSFRARMGPELVPVERRVRARFNRR